MPPAPAEVPAWARRLFDGWHRAECALAVLVFAGMALLLMADVLGRELLAPLLRGLGVQVGGGGIFGAQKLALYLMVVGAYAGVGVATVAGAHVVPRAGFQWLPSRWGPAVDRVADLLAGAVLLAASGWGLQFVHASFSAGVRMPSLGWILWPVQLAIPLGLASAALRYVAFARWPGLRPPPAAVTP